MRMYHSEEVRRLAPEMDPLRLGMGWKLEDLEKPKVIIESTFGDSHPGSAHLDQFVNQALKGIADAGGKGAHSSEDGPARHKEFFSLRPENAD